MMYKETRPESDLLEADINEAVRHDVQEKT
jgi:hypothetical protein